jgi:hypothetical protein
VGSRNTTAGTRYKKMDARPYMAMVGDGRRLATELVVIRASATHEMYATAGALDLAAAVSALLPAGVSIALSEGLPAGASIALTRSSRQPLRTGLIRRPREQVVEPASPGC